MSSISPPLPTTPASAPDQAPLPTHADGIFVQIDRPCITCSYNLRGLPTTGVCPECGSSVQLSLRGLLLQFASPEYLNTIRSGVSLVLNGILLLIVLTVVGIIVGFAFQGSPGVSLVVAAMQLVPTAMILLGYWRFTQPDPGFVGIEKPDSARQIIRIATYVQAGFQVLSLLVLLAGGMLGGGSAPGVLLGALTVIFAIVSAMASIVQFFAMMLYLRWLTQRIPDTYILKRSKTYMWLLPVLYTVGMLVLIGPLVALVLYWNLLDRVRKHLRSIIDTGQPATLPGTAN